MRTLDALLETLNQCEWHDLYLGIWYGAAMGEMSFLVVRCESNISFALNKIDMCLTSRCKLDLKWRLRRFFPERVELVNWMFLVKLVPAPLYFHASARLLTGSCSISKQYRMQAAAIQTLFAPTFKPTQMRRPILVSLLSPVIII
jgi:hypothetical protein